MNTKLTKICVEKVTKLSFNDFKILLDYFSQAIKKEGYTKDFSLLCIDNFITLTKHAEEVQNKINAHFKPNEKVVEYNEKLNDLVAKYADRTEEGKIVLDNKKRPVITEQLVEFQEDQKKLNDTYKDELEKYNEIQKNGNKFLAESFIDITLTKFNDDKDYPDAIVPIVYAILAAN
jgi:predicted nuclease with TOPRIM domain